MTSDPAETEPRPRPSPVSLRAPAALVPGVPAFYDEKELQALIAESPEVLWGGGERAAVTSTEVRVPPKVGRADVVVVDADGSITVVECKLVKNPEHSGWVVDQLLSYAGGLRGLPYDKFRDRFTRGRRVSSTSGFKEDSWGEEAFRRAVSQNLETGRFHLVVAVDQTSKRLRETVASVREHMSDVDLKLVPLGNSAPPPSRPEELIEVIRALNSAAGASAEALWRWAEYEPRLGFNLNGFEGVIRAGDTICRIRKHRELRVSLDKLAVQLGPSGEARATELNSKLEGMGFKRKGGKARIPLESLGVEAFLALMVPIVDDLPNLSLRTDPDDGSRQ